MGNKVGIDMGNSFHLSLGLFHGHDVEKVVLGSAAAGVCEVGVAGPRKHECSLPAIRVEPQNWLQMENSFCARRSTGPAGSQALSSSATATNSFAMVGSDSAFAATASQLGQPQIGSALAQR